jgi:hypothetical protein
MHMDVRVTVKNGYGVAQEFSVDLRHGDDPPSSAYAVPNKGGPRSDRRIRRGTKVLAAVIEAARKIVGEVEVAE